MACSRKQTVPPFPLAFQGRISLLGQGLPGALPPVISPSARTGVELRAQTRRPETAVHGLQTRHSHVCCKRRVPPVSQLTVTPPSATLHRIARV